MNLIWRFLWAMCFSRFSPAVELFAESKTSFCVLPTDIDLLIHMNNGRYFSLMDLGRVDFMIRNKMLPILRKNRVYPVVGSEMIRFRKSLKLFQRFQLTTRLLGWDEKFFYIEHYFIRKEIIYAFSLVKACFLHRPGGLASTTEVMSLLNQDTTSPPLPAWIKDWHQLEKNVALLRPHIEGDAL